MTDATMPLAPQEEPQVGRAWVGGGSGFVWTCRRCQALELVRDDQLTDEAIARSLGICRRTLSTWKAAPPFRAEIQRRFAA